MGTYGLGYMYIINQFIFSGKCLIQAQNGLNCITTKKTIADGRDDIG